MVYLNKRELEIRQILELLGSWQCKEIRSVSASAVRCATKTVEPVTADNADSVIKDEFLSFSDPTHGQHEPLFIHGVDVNVRITGMVDVTLWLLHEDDGALLLLHHQ